MVPLESILKIKEAGIIVKYRFKVIPYLFFFWVPIIDVFLTSLYLQEQVSLEVGVQADTL